MVPVRCRYAGGALQIGQRRIGRLLFGFLDASLHFANCVEIIAHLRAVAGAQFLLQARNVLTHPVEQAGVTSQFRHSVGAAPAIAEEPFEDDAWMRLGGQRRCRRRPRKIVLIHARKTVIAVTHCSEQIHGQLK